ncbi:hypothetical protein [Streptomyces albidochromogenes]|uniref:hypothetical protein n=1 Tax=Streptomyces albidochromogenes TaxID=329524 RepID=UPI00110FF1DD|nr:hypothetical protein [Streptomyces albidochromogenes]
MKALSSSRGLGVSAAALALAMVGSAGIATAAPAPKVEATAATVTAADRCGNHTHYVLDQNYRFWRNCISKSEKIKVDFILWWDSEICVAAGSDTMLGTPSQVRGASRIGDC